MPSVRLEGVSKHYGEVKALTDVTLTCNDHEFLSLAGPTGAGKTTTLKVVAGLEDVTAGTVYIGDSPVNNVGPWMRNVSMTFENYALYPHFSVFDNIASPLRAPRRAKSFTEAQIKDRVTEVAQMLVIEQLLDRNPGQLSGGQRQRVSLARSLTREAAVYLLDEPLSHLDTKLRHRMRSELQRMVRTLDSTIIYVTHDYKEALALSDRVAIIDKGVLHQVGTPDQIFNHPATLFVAGFIGDPPMNLIDCELMTRGQDLYLHSADFELRVPQPLANKVAGQNGHDRQVVLGIRPMHVTPGGGPSDEVVQGEVYAIEPRGDGIAILITKTGDELIAASVPLEYHSDIGQKISLRFELERMNLFDKRTEANLQQ